MRNRPLCSVCLLWIFLIAGIVWFGGEKAEDFFSPSDLETCVEDREEVLVSGTVWKKEFTENRQTYYLTNVSIHIHGRSLRESKIILYRKTNSKKQTENEIFCGNKVKVTGKLRYFDRARNPGNFDQRAYYRRQKIHASVWIDKVLKNRGKREQWRERIWRLREHWKEMLIRQLGKEKGGVLTAMLLGDRSAMDPEIKELYQVNGIAHILAISGLHLSFLGTGFYQFLRKKSGSYPLGCAGGILALSLYVLLVGKSVSVMRAFIMFLFRVGADATGRKYDSSTALAVAAACVLIGQPLYLKDAGFWMSFGAVLAMLLILPVFVELPFQNVWAGLSTQILLLPILLMAYFEISLLSLALNLLVIPLLTILLMMAVLASFLWLVFWQESVLLLKGCGWILAIYEKSCDLALMLPGARVTTGKPDLWQCMLYYLIVGGVLLWIKKRKKTDDMKEDKIGKTVVKGCRKNPDRQKKLRGNVIRVGRKKAGRAERKSDRKSRWAAVLGIGIVTATAVLTIPQNLFSGVQVTMLDVGQGDCIFIRTPDRRAYLIDGGSSDVKNAGKYIIEPYLKSQGIHKLDAVFVTHGDEDHIGAIEEMLKRRKMGVRIVRLIFPPQSVWDEKLFRLAETGQGCGAKICIIEKEKQLLEKSGKEIFRIVCLGPDTGQKMEPGNEASMILAMEYQKRRFLFTGDVEGTGEETLTQELKEHYQNVQWDFLKAAHHGSKNSTKETFLESVYPKYTLVSSGRNNRYGHPHKETLKRLEKYGSRMYGTASSGAVTIRVNGRKAWLTQTLGACYY